MEKLGPFDLGKVHCVDCLEAMKLPPDILMRRAHGALSECVQPLDFGAALKTLPREESLRTKKNRALEDLRENS